MWMTSSIHPLRLVVSSYCLREQPDRLGNATWERARSLPWATTYNLSHVAKQGCQVFNRRGRESFVTVNTHISISSLGKHLRYSLNYLEVTTSDNDRHAHQKSSSKAKPCVSLTSFVFRSRLPRRTISFQWELDVNFIDVLPCCCRSLSARKISPLLYLPGNRGRSYIVGCINGCLRFSSCIDERDQATPCVTPQVGFTFHWRLNFQLLFPTEKVIGRPPSPS